MDQKNDDGSRDTRRLRTGLLWLFMLLSFTAVSASAAEVKLAWDANTEPDLAGYRVFCRLVDAAYDYSSPAWEGPGTTCTIENLEDGKTYCFVVRAYNTAGVESGDSNEARYEPQIQTPTPPVADAGSDRIVAEGDSVTLDGSGSHDPDGTIVAYAWQQTDDAPNVTLSGADTSRPAFVAPSVGVTSVVLTFQLSVTDNHGLTASDTVEIRVNDLMAPDSDGDGVPDDQDLFPDDPDESADNDADGIGDNRDTDDDNDGFSDSEEDRYGTDPTDGNSIPQPPAARISAPASAEEGTTVTLDGTVSDDPDGTVASYLWQQLAGPEVVLSGDRAGAPTFVAPAVDGEGDEISFRLTVTDDDGFADTTEFPIRIDDNGIEGFPREVLTFYSANEQPIGNSIHENGDLVRLEAVDPDEVAAPENRPDALHYGLIDMDIKVDSPGATAILTIYLPEPAPEGYVWYNYSDQNGWQDFSDYTEFSDDRREITLVLTDGGPGDNDGAADGIIRDPSGLGLSGYVAAATDDSDTSGGAATSSSSGGGGGCFVASSQGAFNGLPVWPAGLLVLALAVLTGLRGKKG